MWRDWIRARILRPGSRDFGPSKANKNIAEIGPNVFMEDITLKTIQKR